MSSNSQYGRTPSRQSQSALSSGSHDDGYNSDDFDVLDTNVQPFAPVMLTTAHKPYLHNSSEHYQRLIVYDDIDISDILIPCAMYHQLRHVHTLHHCDLIYHLFLVSFLSSQSFFTIVVLQSFSCCLHVCHGQYDLRAPPIFLSAHLRLCIIYHTYRNTEGKKNLLKNAASTPAANVHLQPNHSKHVFSC